MASSCPECVVEPIPRSSEHLNELKVDTMPNASMTPAELIYNTAPDTIPEMLPLVRSFLSDKKNNGELINCVEVDYNTVRIFNGETITLETLDKFGQNTFESKCFDEIRTADGNDLLSLWMCINCKKTYVIYNPETPGIKKLKKCVICPTVAWNSRETSSFTTNNKNPNYMSMRELFQHYPLNNSTGKFLECKIRYTKRRIGELVECNEVNYNQADYNQVETIEGEIITLKTQDNIFGSFASRCPNTVICGDKIASLWKCKDCDKYFVIYSSQ